MYCMNVFVCQLIGIMKLEDEVYKTCFTEKCSEYICLESKSIGN